jgi:hypothetical protein
MCAILPESGGQSILTRTHGTYRDSGNTLSPIPERNVRGESLHLEALMQLNGLFVVWDNHERATADRKRKKPIWAELLPRPARCLHSVQFFRPRSASGPEVGSGDIRNLHIKIPPGLKPSERWT